MTNLSTQSSAVDLHGQLNPRMCSTWPNNWLYFIRFCDQIGWHGFGQAGDRQAPLVKLFRCFSGNSNWTGQLGVARRICKDAFDWQARGSAGDGPGLNSAWRARCEWPGHPDPDGPAPKTSVPEPFGSYVEASAAPLSTRTVPFS